MTDIRPLLAALQSPDAAVRQPAEQRVASLEAAPGFLAALQAAAAPGSGLDEAGRGLATIVCKNVVTRHWVRRGHAQHALHETDKQQLRASVLRRLHDPSRLVIAQVLQVVVALLMVMVITNV